MATVAILPGRGVAAPAARRRCEVQGASLECHSFTETIGNKLCQWLLEPIRKG